MWAERTSLRVGEATIGATRTATATFHGFGEHANRVNPTELVGHECAITPSEVDERRVG